VVRDPPQVQPKRGDVEGDQMARFDEAVGSRAKEPERQWQMPAYRAVCARQLLPMREEVAEVVGALLLELGPQMAELEAAFDEEVAAAEGPMWQLVADAKRRLVRDACDERCTEVRRQAIAAIWVASPQDTSGIVAAGRSSGRLRR